MGAIANLVPNIVSGEENLTLGDLKGLAFVLRGQDVELRQALVIIDSLWEKNSEKFASVFGDELDAKALEVLEYVKQVYEDTQDINLSDKLDDWIISTEGWFSVTECDRDLGIVTERDKNNRRQILHRRVKKGLLERHPTKNGLFRKVISEAPEIEWVAADVSNIYPMKFPFELEKYVVMYPKNIAVIAAPPNFGKTAWLLNVLKLNMDEFKVHYFCSEMGAEELKVRLSKFDDVAENEWTFDPRERSTNFGDVIYPDDMNIIDYIEIPEGNFYLVASEMRAIHDKLRKGVAIIALQKKEGAEYGRGAELSAEKARLYVTMDRMMGVNVLRIKKGKNWAQEGVNPNGMEFPYHLVQGAKFIY